ncbi:ligase-associated DNA damage response endonuclease PdeM [Pseudoduganella sp. GCM10020061]|uniref:ligase-associated DNA damage response endonuclease PdeM n=1 Tax=Pseudoduganella sp. GCM10020061 TaxID=3317345 RepID=UPI0036426D3F
MSGAHTIELAGESVMLLPEKALYWPRERTLVVADIHFGKAAAFRALGVPVPRGTTTQNLEALDRLLAVYPATRIVFLGDFLHARAAHAKATLGAMAEWRARNPGLSLVLVRGNHDLHAGDPAAVLGIEMVDEPFEAGPFAFCHHPDIAADGYVLAGHVHPVFRIATRLESVRLPCFVAGPRRMILPSFGAFTGGHAIEPVAGERVYVATEVQVHPVR